jgi:hypothetical protein
MRRILGLAIAIGVGACGGGGDTEYSSLPPAEAGAQLADRGCDAAFDCGILALECDPAPAGHYAPATSAWPDHDACLSDLSNTYVNEFTGCAALGLTAEQAALIDECFNEDLGCLSAAEIQDFANAFCNDLPFPGPCGEAAVVLQACDACFEDPTDPMCDGA